MNLTPFQDPVSPQRLALSHTPELQAITPDNLLWLGFWLFIDNGHPTRGVADVNIWTTPTSDDHDNVDPRCCWRRK